LDRKKLRCMPPGYSSSVLAGASLSARHSEAEPRLLVAYASGVLAAAISRRLALSADVDLVPAREAPRRLRGDHPYDAVIVCPYLTEPEFTRLREAVTECVRRPVLIDIHESIGHIDAEIQDWGRPDQAAALRPIVEALTT
jgi:hypothetical protein